MAFETREDDHVQNPHLAPHHRLRRRGSPATAPAWAVVTPGTFATARDDQLIVVSSAIVGARTVEMMGGWKTRPCRAATSAGST
jgi:hypothetical protein